MSLHFKLFAIPLSFVIMSEFVPCVNILLYSYIAYKQSLNVCNYFDLLMTKEQSLVSREGLLCFLESMTWNHQQLAHSS